jgi:hypothetical protein
MRNTAKHLASVLVPSFSCWQAFVAFVAHATGKDHQLYTDNKAKIKKRFTDANITQEASAFG